MSPNAHDEKEGQRWVKLSQMEEGPLLHPPFEDKGVRRLLRRIRGTLAEVEPLTVEQWEDGFRRDHHPDREIVTWLHIAAVYRHFTERRTRSRPSLKHKQEVFQICLWCSLNGPQELQATADLSTPSWRAAEAIIRYYFDKLPLVSEEDRATLQRYFHPTPQS